ncbi:hypothetical protein Cob_v011783 [Colletotrichum orbiculare MAFF 240422]|uniref:Uncharacterized protein n=1 Tax=Colletotrichum orbiculare (strain 104-T / ATCC 96160 / CBS 514.97 / LARS 414 / MAFF 240422) TaxID=1213857 RepID=A0A484FCJ8_COLOR|nr:hypothetical protein Cob_v011783 [Colletotrichum orbiculare MAFF 240422]
MVAAFFSLSEQKAMSKRMTQLVSQCKINRVLKSLESSSSSTIEQSGSSLVRSEILGEFAACVTNSSVTIVSPKDPRLPSRGFTDNFSTVETSSTSSLDASTIWSLATRSSSPTSSPLSFHISQDVGANLEVSLSSHADFLLDYYKSQMGKLFSPIRVRKPPWSMLHFPRAVAAFSELSVFKTARHAHVALLHADGCIDNGHHIGCNRFSG